MGINLDRKYNAGASIFEGVDVLYWFQWVEVPTHAYSCFESILLKSPQCGLLFLCYSIGYCTNVSSSTYIHLLDKPSTYTTIE